MPPVQLQLRHVVVVAPPTLTVIAVDPVLVTRTFLDPLDVIELLPPCWFHTDPVPVKLRSPLVPNTIDLTPELLASTASNVTVLSVKSNVPAFQVKSPVDVKLSAKVKVVPAVDLVIGPNVLPALVIVAVALLVRVPV